MIELSNVTAGYGDHTVIQGMSYTFPSSGCFALMGASGSGKTTILRLIAGLLMPAKGEIKRDASPRIGYLFQEDRLLPWLNALDNVKTVASDEAAKTWLRKMEIGDVSAYPRELSGGMQRRVALARALAFPSDVLLMDEPFKGLDDALKARIAPLILANKQLIILSTHDMDEAKAMQAEIIYIHPWVTQQKEERETQA